jgi:anti-anti-sigma regulatory factor
VRSTGTVNGVSWTSPGDHVCWTFGTAGEARQRSVEMLSAGLFAGEGLLYTADRPTRAALLDDLEALADDPAELVARGQLSVERLTDLYTPGGVLDAAYRIDGYQALTDQALAEGWRGLRVAADATLLVTEPAWRAEFARYEFEVGRWMASSAMSALCLYDRTAIGDHTADLACVHPLRHDHAATFSLWGTGDVVRLSGEVDADQTDRFGDALGIAAAVVEGDLEIDLSDLEFLSATACVPLARLGAAMSAQGRELVLHRAPRVVRTVWKRAALDRIGPARFTS